MPTVILLDSSLSMSRPVENSDTSEDFTLRHLAIHGINTFLDYVSEHCRLEFISLVEFSSTSRTQVAFTRDYEQIRTSLVTPDDKFGDKTCLEEALRDMGQTFTTEWGVYNPCQILLITDGCTGIGQGSLKESMATASARLGNDDKFPLPFTFPAKVHILCLAPPGDKNLQAAIPLYDKMLQLNNNAGELFMPDAALGLKPIHDLFLKVSEKYFAPFLGSLKTGNLKCNIQLFPAPDVYSKDHDFEHMEKSVSRVIEVLGFLDISDLASPPFISRHLIIPVANTTDNEVDVKEEEEEAEGKQAAFTVLLHGSLKVESMVALTQLADDWFGLIYSWADTKKKSNLMLTVLKPGVDLIPWLGNITHLAPTEDFQAPPYGEEDSKSPFPIRPSERRSYAQNCVVWLKQTGIQADIQKILRNARKLPEKQQQFYKELNRLRRAALAFGFNELMDAVAQLLERECTMLPGNAHPDAALQLTHAANSLKTDKRNDSVQNVQPLRTNFSGD